MAPETSTPLKIARISIAVGLFLAVIKLLAGYFGNSHAVFADGVESAGDVVASLILWLGLRISAEPPDEDHPYGHGRFEILAGQAIGAVLIASGSILAWQSYLHLQQAQVAPQVFAIWTVVISVGMKIALARWKFAAARQFRSAALGATAANDWLDVLSGAIAIIAVGLNLWRPERFSHADAIGGVVIALLVIVLGVNVLRDSSWELLDSMPSEEMLREIRTCALTVPGALGIEQCRARKTGLQYHVDLHLEVNPEMTVDAAHRIGGQVRAAIREQLSWVADVLIHIEPAPGHHRN